MAHTLKTLPSNTLTSVPLPIQTPVVSNGPLLPPVASVAAEVTENCGVAYNMQQPCLAPHGDAQDLELYPPSAPPPSHPISPSSPSTSSGDHPVTIVSSQSDSWDTDFLDEDFDAHCFPHDPGGLVLPDHPAGISCGPVIPPPCLVQSSPVDTSIAQCDIDHLGLRAYVDHQVADLMDSLDGDYPLLRVGTSNFWRTYHHGYLLGHRRSGGVYVRVCNLGDKREVVVMFNPSRVGPGVLAYLNSWFEAFGISPGQMQLHRVDAAVDYALARERLIYDRRLGKVKFFVPTHFAHETAAWGYRRGASKQVLLYDKAAERRNREVHAPLSDLSRLEARQRLPRLKAVSSGGAIRTLSQLRALPWGFDRDHLREFAVLPSDACSDRDRFYLAMAGRCGIRATAKVLRTRHGELAVIALLSYLPKVFPQPRDVYEANWPSVVTRRLAELITFTD